MFKELLQAITQPRKPVEPRQGKRLVREERDGKVLFTIKGQGRPGLLVFFGLIFSVIPSVVFFTLLFGTSTFEGGSSEKLFTFLFLIPFIVIGMSTFLTGLFLWLGSTQLTVDPDKVHLQHQLFGKIFRQKLLPRTGLDIHFKENYRNNDIPVFKLNLSSKNSKDLGVGGSLKEAELLWLYQELKAALGEEADEMMGIAEALAAGGLEDINTATLISNYRSRNLQIDRTTRGWEARFRPSIPIAIVLTAFGSIFLVAGLLMGSATRGFLLDLVPPIRDAFATYNSSGDAPPLWFALGFGIMGSIVVLFGVFTLGYRLTLSRQHSRLHLDRRWTLFLTSKIFQLSDLKDLEITATGHVNNVPRYRLNALWKNGKSTKIVGFATADDVGQLHAHLSAEIK